MIRGSLVALVTPFLDQSAERSSQSQLGASQGLKPDVDWLALERLVDWHVAAGTSAIVSVGTTGESATLTMGEHSEVIRRTVEFAHGRIPVVAGTGANSTLEALELTQAAKAAGADAALLVTPYYNKPTQAGLIAHHQLLAEQVDIPQILYNVPGRTGCDMSPETVLTLAEIDNIIGVKEATADLDRIVKIKQAAPNFLVYSGDDPTSTEAMLLGADGTISVTANVVPGQLAKMANAAIAGDRALAESLNQPLQLLHQRLFLESNPIPVKWALAAMGKIGPGIRLPLLPLSEAHQAPLLDSLETLELLP